MKFHQLAIEDALRSLSSRRLGLTAQEAERRLGEFGPNRVQSARRRPLIYRLLSELTHFFALILWVAAAMAFWAEWEKPGQGMGTLGCAIIAVVLINSVFSFWQVWRAERALKSLEKLLPRRAKAIRDEVFVEILIERLFLGVIEAAAAMAAYFVVLRSAGWIYGQAILPGSDLHSAYLQATTACLAAIVVMQIANVLICRSNVHSLFQQSLFSNKLLAIGIGMELLMIGCISYTSVGNRIFQAAPLPGYVWLFLAPLPLLMIAFEEIRKSIVRSQQSRSSSKT